ncbi:MAG: DUF2961 domain-containing protein [Rhodothermales bacterium]
MQNSLWSHDYYPELPDLAPQSTLEIGRFDGPGIIRTIHLTLNIEGGDRNELLRGTFLVIRYDHNRYASVHAPVGDFFCDSFGGESIPFASCAMAKRPTNSLFSYLPMPFAEHAVIELVNETDKKVTGYGYVTAEKVGAWDDDNAYFHAKWINRKVRLPNERVPLLDTVGEGHFLGCHLTAVSECPHFAENMGICEGNDEFFIDGSLEPTCNYLGTEDFFGFSWNWRELWYDDYSGTTYLDDEGGVTKLACYRFLLNDPIRFQKSLNARINYEYERHNVPLKNAKQDQNGDVHFGIVVYWYQGRPVDVGDV